MYSNEQPLKENGNLNSNIKLTRPTLRSHQDFEVVLSRENLIKNFVKNLTKPLLKIELFHIKFLTCKSNNNSS